MEIGLTANLKKKCNISKLPEATEENLFYCWDVDIARYKNRIVLYIANSNNRFGCIICGMKLSAYKNIADYTVMQIKDILALNGYSEEDIEAYISKAGEATLTKTHGKKAIGAMNRAFMDFLCTDHNIDPTNELQAEPTTWLNRILGKSAGYNDDYSRPSESFVLDMEKNVLKVDQSRIIIEC
jgi:hypothetical protein